MYILKEGQAIEQNLSLLLLHKNKDIEKCDSAWFRFVPPSPLVFAIKIKWWNGFFAGSVGPRAEGEGDKDGCTFQERPLVRSSAKMEPGNKKTRMRKQRPRARDAIKAFNAGGKTSRFHGSIVKCTNQSFAKSAGKLSISRITTMESLSQA